MRSCRTPQVRYDNCKPAAQNKSLMLVWEKLEGGELSSFEEPPLLPPASTSADSTWGVPNTHSWIERNKQPVPKKAKRNTLSQRNVSIRHFQKRCAKFLPPLWALSMMQGARLVNKGGKISRKETNKHPTNSTKKTAQFPKEKKWAVCVLNTCLKHCLLCQNTSLIQSFNIKLKVRWL